MVDVFISYKRDERSQASGIARRLRKLGLDVWLDEKIATGTQFDAEIESALRVAKAILVLWSPGSVRSEWVRNETAFGVQQGNLVAIMLSPCELPLAFRSVQYEPIFDKSFKDDHPRLDQGPRENQRLGEQAARNRAKGASAENFSQDWSQLQMVRYMGRRRHSDYYCLRVRRSSRQRRTGAVFVFGGLAGTKSA
jgi:hypothetical protein